MGNGADAAEPVAESLDRIAVRSGELVPDRGFLQAKREVASGIEHAPEHV